MPSTDIATKEELQKLYFRTTTSSTFNLTGAPKEANSENMLDVHFIGQRPGKYLPYQAKRAPLLDRSSCCYTKDFVVLPLGDAPITREMAKVNKTRGSNFKSGLDAQMETQTKYREDFRPPSRTEARNARPASAKPAATRSTTLPTGKLMESTSVAHQAFRLQPAIAQSQPVKPPKSHLGLAQHVVQLTTSYRDEFGYQSPSRPKLQRCRSAPAQGRVLLNVRSDVSSFVKGVSKQRPSTVSKVSRITAFSGK